jgi:antitoxin component HigA of HigAB toxin-antitoxin module
MVPCFTSDLFETLGMSSMHSIALVSLIGRYEPMIMRQKASRKNTDAWRQILERRLNHLTEIGSQFKRGEEPQDFDEWHSDVKAYLATAEEFSSWRQIEEIEGMSVLRHLYDSVTAPERSESDEEEYFPSSSQENYWTIDRIFEDL